MMDILEVKSLTKQYRSGSSAMIEVFHNLTFTIARGEVVTLTGTSGSGKSTLLNVIGTLDQSNGGSVLIAGQDISKINGAALAAFRNKHIGFIFQFHHLLPEFTALENVMMPALIAGRSHSEATKRGETLIEAVGLSNRANHRPSELSGGEAQRVAIARAFMMEPTLVLADEPTGNLDPENADKLFALILSLAEQYHQTFLIATHNLELAAKANRTMHLDKGAIVV